MYDSPFLIKNKYKITICKFCETEIISKHFARHLRNNHARETAVIEIIQEEDLQKRKQLIALLRNDGNMDSAINGRILPKRKIKHEEASAETHSFCPDCKTQLKLSYLSRHRKTCFAKKPNDDADVARKQEVMNSFIFVACQKKYGEVINKMFLKSEVLARMRGDAVAQEILKDILILSWGDDLLKKNS